MWCYRFTSFIWQFFAKQDFSIWKSRQKFYSLSFPEFLDFHVNSLNSNFSVEKNSCSLPKYLQIGKVAWMKRHFFRKESVWLGLNRWRSEKQKQNWKKWLLGPDCPECLKVSLAKLFKGTEKTLRLTSAATALPFWAKSAKKTLTCLAINRNRLVFSWNRFF